MKEDSLKAIRKFTGIDNIETIGLDDTFGFKCQQCGKCCMNRKDIILNPFDVYNGAKYLGITPLEFLEKYCFTDLGGYSKIPMVLLATSDNGFCPLLKFDIKDGGKFKCTIHPAKPGACANHPIGVAYSTSLSDNHQETTYVKVDQCSNSVSDEQQLVREWIKPYLDNQAEIDIAHEIQSLAAKYFDPRKFWLLLSFLAKMSETLENKSEKASELGKEVIAMAAAKYLSSSIALGYTSYDINRPFIEQAKENMEKLDKFYTETKAIYETMKDAFNAITGKSFEDEYDDFEKHLKEQEGDVTDGNDN